MRHHHSLKEQHDPTKKPDPIAFLEQAAAHTQKYVAGVKPNQPSDATPCEKWDVKQSVDHITGVPLFGISLFAAGAPMTDEAHDASKGGTTVDAYDKNVKKFVDLLKKPGTLQKTVKFAGNDMPGVQAAMILVNDIMVHGWDLAKATHQDTKMPQPVLQACYAAMSPNFANMSKMGTAFKPVVQAAPSADMQAKHLAGLGRRA